MKKIFLILLASLPLAAQTPIVIRGARVVDGTGNPAKMATVPSSEVIALRQSATTFPLPAGFSA